jgi:hypothetical protein
MNIQKFLVLGFLLFIGSCKEKPTTPIDPDAALPAGRRDYTWTVDTLNVHSAFFWPQGIWGSSPNDVWLINRGGDDNIWHYDGQQWSPYPVSGESYITPSSIYGFASNDIWVCGEEGRILHYDGQSWKLFAAFSPLRPVEYPYVFCNDVWGDAPNNVWIAGFMQSADGKKAVSCILHYDGQSWDFVSIPNFRVSLSQIRRGIKESNNYYLSSLDADSTGITNRFFEFDGQHSLREILSSQKIPLSLHEVDGRIYFTYNNNQLLKYYGSFQIFRDFTASGMPFGDVFGRNSKDLFLVSYDYTNPQFNVLRHYNGTDLVMLYNAIPCLFDGFAIYKSEVFLPASASPNYAPIVIHGKLKN